MSTFEHAVAAMDTLATITVVGEWPEQAQRDERAARVARAADWFHEVETRCTRFDPASELRSLTHTTGAATHVSDIVFEAVRFAISLAHDTDGAFDPTVGLAMERRGFNREYKSGARVETVVPAHAHAATFRDVELDESARTITLRQPLVLDLGAVAKGLAIDLAARELAPFNDFMIDAGGDVFVAGHSPRGGAWHVGVQHPRERTSLVTVALSGHAICTSGDYERKTTRGAAGHHILDARSKQSPASLASATVIAPTAMAADAFSTAAFALGPEEGIALLERHGVHGLLVSTGLEQFTTKDFRSFVVR